MAEIISTFIISAISSIIISEPHGIENIVYDLKWLRVTFNITRKQNPHPCSHWSKYGFGTHHRDCSF